MSVLTILVGATLVSTASQAELVVVKKGCQSKTQAVDFTTQYNTSTAAAINRSGLASVSKQQIDDQIAKDLESMSRYYRIVEDIKDCPGEKFLAPETKD